MSTDMYRKALNTRQRITSTFFNRLTSLAARNLQEALRRTLGGDASRSGVIGGLTCSINGGTMTVTVAAGLALLLDAAFAHPDSQYRWCELPLATSVNIPAADPANPRWDVIEIAPGNVTIGATLVDRWNPATGAFVSTSLDDEFQPSPTISVRSGTPAASPVFPAGVAGRIPLAYCYVPAAAASLTRNDLVHCRPVLRATDDVFEAGVPEVQGGGVAVASAGATITLRPCRGRFANAGTPFAIAASTLAIAATAGWDGAADPGVDAIAHFYAVPVPFPSGYDASLATREFRPEANAATRFPSLVNASLSGCLVIASTTAPTTGTVTGAPSSGNFQLTAPPFSSIALNVPRSSAIYLGASYWDDSASGFVPQIEQSGWVWPTTAPGIPSTQIHDGTIFSLAINDPVDVRDGILPVTAQEVRCALVVTGGTAATARIGFDDELTNATGSGSHLAAWAGGVPTVAEFEFTAYPDASGNITFTAGAVTAATTDLGGADLRSMAYRDCVIGRR